jgi:hypothetical protein
MPEARPRLNRWQMVSPRWNKEFAIGRSRRFEGTLGTGRFLPAGVQHHCTIRASRGHHAMDHEVIHEERDAM